MAFVRGSFRQGRSVSRPARRKSVWGLGPGSTDALSLIASSASIVGSGVAPISDGLTVVRIRGELLLSLENAVTALDGFRGAFGIGDVSLPAFTAGIGSIPTPLAEESDENWLYHRYFTIIAASAPGETWANAGSPTVRIEVDSKAMRKQDTDRVLYAAIEVVETGAAQMDCSFNSRILDLLP